MISKPSQTILVMAANPQEMPRLRLDKEVRAITDVLQRGKARDQFSLVSEMVVVADDVRQALLNYKPSIVHFAGHGSTEGLMLEDENGQLKLISADALGGLFQLFPQVNCVVLNACYSETQAEAIVQYIDYVIGMSHNIGDVAAIRFAIGFYSAIGAGKSIGFAYKMGANAIHLAGIPEHLTPVLRQKQIATSIDSDRSYVSTNELDSSPNISQLELKNNLNNVSANSLEPKGCLPKLRVSINISFIVGIFFFMLFLLSLFVMSTTDVSNLAKLGFWPLEWLILPIVIVGLFIYMLIYIISNPIRRERALDILSRQFIVGSEPAATEPFQRNAHIPLNLRVGFLTLVDNSGNLNVPQTVQLNRGAMRIGRTLEFADVAINDIRISKLHCKIIQLPVDGSFWLMDEGSTTGTYVNGVEVPITGCKLKFGELIGIGPLTYQFITNDPA